MRAAALALILLAASGCSAKPASDPAATLGDDCRPAAAEKPFAFGAVADAAGARLAGATLNGRGLAHRHDMATTADARGCYHFTFPVAQPHDVEASKPGYKPSTARSIMLNEGEERKINFRLDPA